MHYLQMRPMLEWASDGVSDTKIRLHEPPGTDVTQAWNCIKHCTGLVLFGSYQPPNSQTSLITSHYDPTRRLQLLQAALALPSPSATRPN